MTSVTEKQSVTIQREKRAKAIAAMGLVTRVKDKFEVSTPSLRGKMASYEVWRDERGMIRCNCLEFEDSIIDDPKFRCEHIMAVKHGLTAKNTESITQKRKLQRANKVRDKTMRNEKIAKETNKSVKPEQADNVLDFSNSYKELRETFVPNRVIKPERSHEFDWITAVNILDEIALDWSHSIRNVQRHGELVTVTVAVTINGITREGIGTGDAVSKEDIVNAEHDALVRAALKFRSVREFETNVIGIENKKSPQADPFPENPIARSLGDLVSAKQLGMIRAICRLLKIKADEECNSIMKCRTDELSKKAASSMISHLQLLQKHVQMPLRMAS